MCPLFLSDFNEAEFFRQIFQKYPNMKFDENPSCGSRADKCSWTDGKTDTTELIVAFGNFANSPNNVGQY